MSSRFPVISDKLILSVRERIRENKRVRRFFPSWGRVHIDRQLPFLCVYRRRPTAEDIGTERLIMGEASYLFTLDNRRLSKGLRKFVQGIANTQIESFGSFLIFEIWEMQDGDFMGDGPEYKPYFQIASPVKTDLTSTIEMLEDELKQIRMRNEFAVVDIVKCAKICRPDLAPLLSVHQASTLGCHVLGLKVRPIYRNNVTGEIYPLVRRTLHRRLSRPFKRTFYEFTRKHTTHRPPHYTALGRRSVVKAVWEVDKLLAEVSNEFDFLLQVTPINTEAAWSYFKKKKFNTSPEFVYRRLPIDPALSKRRLFKIPIERIEDPTLAYLFRDQQNVLDRKLTLLSDLGTERFRYGSIQLYGKISEELLTAAQEILTQFTPHSHDEKKKISIDAHKFAIRAKEEFDCFKAVYPDMNSRVEIRDDIDGLMVSQGNLLIGRHLAIPTSRVEALVQHEVGTHVLTYYNGRFQPFQQLYVGLSGYDELQEGIAVFAEYLVGGLSRPRLRTLAGRVMAVHGMNDGGTFLDIFRELHQRYHFRQRTAFTITMRVFRGGGLTKDAVYLRGLIQLLDYLRNGGAFEPLLVGKIALNHISMIRELQWRQVLAPSPLRPRYMESGQALTRLAHVRGGLRVIDLIERRTK